MSTPIGLCGAFRPIARNTAFPFCSLRSVRFLSSFVRPSTPFSTKNHIRFALQTPFSSRQIRTNHSLDGNESEDHPCPSSRTLTVDTEVLYPETSAVLAAPAPTFQAPAVVDGEIKNVFLDDYKGKWVVLLFYPKDFTFVCPTELIAFNDRRAEFEKLQAQVLAISTDTENSHLAWTRTARSQGGLGPMQIPILADAKKTIASAYGVLSEDEGIAFRGLFIIDNHGILQQQTVNNFPVGRSVDETLRLLQAFQFVQKHGEVCPANWQPGEKTIIPNPEDSAQYFSSIKEVRPTSKNLHAVKNEQDLESIVQSKEKVVVEFMASWCGKCQQIFPFIDNLAKEKTNVTFVQVHVEEKEGKVLKEKYGVNTLPTFLFFKDGKKISNEVAGYKKGYVADQVEAL